MKPLMPVQSPEEIVQSLGRRIKARRLAANVSQATLADKAQISRRALIQLEGGHGSTLHTLASVMKALGLDHELLALAPAPTVSPMAMLLLKGKARKRAS
ncbi:MULTISPECIES: helix-turn-helix transcriptional regulator [Stenotrophomonas]|uniref:helix-turn-helix domain-containing protein n=1 Tax=Stenotrophomonas TaxID=40323 RepID=UPI00289815A8|nr:MULTISPECIES: helix-turn-helix transcriptional regulator [Stenotrophomonas]